MHVIKQVKKSWLISLLLIGCSTTDHAPVIDRAPAAKKPASSQVKPASPGADWRPNTHTVKKGDTLYSIGLEYGYDYKEIAQANNIAGPAFTIHIGQQLTLPARATDTTTAAATPIPGQPASIADGDVIITPLNLDGSTPPVAQPGQPDTGQSPAPGQPLLVVEPKAVREPYSLAAMNAPVASPKPQVAAPTVPVTPVATGSQPDAPLTASPAASNTEDGIQWAWPTNGKVIGNFNDSASAKGLDISGTQGQAINAAAPGKVIYSGSDLRGYGKLVIIKHNNTYLSVYAHNSNILVKEGQQVSRGQKIAEMGNTDADKVKLHFEIRRQGKSVDPAKYLPGSPG